MKYRYRVYRTAWVDIEIEAGNEDAAQAEYEELESGGWLNDDFRDAVLEEESNVAEVWEGGIEEGLCIYSAY